VTRFVPGGYQPEHAGESTVERVTRAVDGLGELIDDYEFHYPQELFEENLDDVREALGGHGIYAVCTGTHLNPRFGKGGLSSPDDAVRSDAVAEALAAASFAGEVGAQMVLWPGVDGYNYRSRRPTATRGRASSTASARSQAGAEAGPAKPLELQWATYYDAADQAGISRLFMGIHVSPRRLRRTEDRRVAGGKPGRSRSATSTGPPASGPQPAASRTRRALHR